MRYGNVELHNVWDIISSDDTPGITLSRLPLSILHEINPGARDRSNLGAGCEIRGMLPPGGSATVTLQTVSANIIPPLAEVCYGNTHDATVLIEKDPTTITISEPANMALLEEIHQKAGSAFNPRLVRIALPHLHTCRLISVDGDLTYPEMTAAPSETMLAYGSSITNGAHAVRPTGTYASQTALHLGCDLINLGFGGSAHMDDAIARHIAERDDWDFATLEMGINVRAWPREMFYDTIDNFVDTIVSAQPEKYVFCIDLFTNNQDFVKEPTHGVGFREAVRAVAEKRCSDKVIHIDGRSILKNPAGLRPDLVHPGDQGMIEMGQNLAETIRRLRPRH